MRDLKTVLCHLHSRSQLRYPHFQSCPECRAEALHETIVVEAVINYFSESEFRKLFIETERKIQMGSDTRRADIVLLDKSEGFIAIAECKQIGIVTYGHKQLKSYLCATDTKFGIFANSTDPGDWEFYENFGQNRFGNITREQFETEVGVSLRIKPISKAENGLIIDRTSRARFARRREKAKRSSQRNT